LEGLVQVSLPIVQAASTLGGAPQTVELAFKGTRRGYYASADPSLKEGEYVVVAVERGWDLGRVRSIGGVAARKCAGCGSDAEDAALRRAEPHEVEQLHVLRADEERVRRTAREMAGRHSLDMKVTEAEWQWDRNKLTIYFTSERRVDFRQLVRELARTFRTRIELKQIGVRDEAALLGGVGRCGRELCCATWLRQPKSVSLQLAKDQNLSLNPQQISGTCGRLLCCLTYEHDAYLQARKRFPREGKTLRTSLGAERVIGIDVWRDRVTLLDEARQRRVVELADLRAEMAAAEPARKGTAAEPAKPPAPPEAEVPAEESRRPAGRRRSRGSSRRSGE
jgi:cell fate regulator YaaT (PSP1 superfamily)